MENKQETIPKGWRESSLGDFILDIKDGGTPSRNKKDFFNGGIPWVTVKDIRPRIKETLTTISDKGLKNSSAKLWPKGTVILSFGATIGEVGIAEVPLTTKQGIAGIIPNPKKITKEYLYYFLLTQKKKLNQLASGSTIKEVRPSVIKKHIKILLPPLSQQKKIAEILSGVDDKIEINQKIKDQLTQLKKGLMQDLLSGMVRVG